MVMWSSSDTDQQTGDSRNLAARAATGKVAMLLDSRER